MIVTVQAIGQLKLVLETRTSAPIHSQPQKALRLDLGNSLQGAKSVPDIRTYYKLGK